MDHGRYLDFCYDEYARLEKQSHQLYVRAGFILTALVAMTAGVVAIGDVSVLRQWGRFDIGLYALTWICWAILSAGSMWCLARAVLMRRYERLALAGIAEFRGKCLSDAEVEPEGEVPLEVERYILAKTAMRLMQANEHNDELNQSRYRYLDHSLRLLVLSVVVAAFNALSMLVIAVFGSVPNV